MATKPKVLTAAQQKERRALASGIVEAIAGSTIVFEVLDKTDGLYTGQLVRVALEITDKLIGATE